MAEGQGAGELVDQRRDRPGMWAWPRWRRTTLPFLLSTRALSFERRGRERVNSARSFSSRAATHFEKMTELLAGTGIVR